MRDFTEQSAATWMAEALAERESQGRRRILRTMQPRPDGQVEVGGRLLMDLSSNDYLGLGRRCGASPAALASGALASRLVVGNHPGYEAVEAAVAALKGTERALVIGSGYLANTGIIPALVGRDDCVLSDRLNHASIVDGIILSRAHCYRYRHNDPEHLEAMLRKAPAGGRRLIVTDTIFSMDGDLAELHALVQLKRRYGAMLMVDEAHSGGVFGPDGAGLVRALGLTDEVDVQMGTFSKAYGAYGAYVAGSQVVIDYLTNYCRSVIFSTALPPAVLASIQEALELSCTEPWRRETVIQHGELMRQCFIQAGLDTGASRCQIVPVLVGSDTTATAFSKQLEAAGICGVAIRPPTVPEGSARIRFSLSAVHARAAVLRAAETIIDVARSCGIIAR